MDTISQSRTVFEIFDFKVFKVWSWPLNSERHLGSTDFIRFGSPYVTSYMTSMDTTSLSRTVFEIFDSKDFRVWTWFLTSENHLGSKKNQTIRKPIYDFLFDFYGHHLSISYRFRYIRLQSFPGLTLTYNLWRSSGVEEIQTNRKPIYDFLFDFYGHHLSISYRFWDIRLQSFQGLTLTINLWRSSGVEEIHTIRKPVYDFLVDFDEHHLSISHRFRDIRLQSFWELTLTFDLWRSSGFEEIHTIRKPIFDFLFDFHEHQLFISYRLWDIRLQSVQGLTLTFDL